jgi:cytochrome c peroxidase
VPSPRPTPPAARLLAACLLAAALLGSACRALPPAPPAGGPGAATPAWEADNPVRPLPTPPLGSPADFAATPWVTPEKVRLGRWLFHDARLSADATLSCASCHRSEHGYSEPTAHSTGIRGQQGTRKAPPILNAAWPIYPVWFWDGRAASLAEQAKGPLANPIEMASPLDAVVAAVAARPGYRRAFAEAFGDGPIDIDRIAEALAAYEATRLSGNSRADRFDAGDEAALTPPQRRGRELFFGRAACNKCHLGPNYSDSRFYNLGAGWRPPPPGAPPASGFADPGRAAVSGDPRDTGAFKTPTLREVSRRAPYMHDGSLTTLRAAVVHYRSGGLPNPWLSDLSKPIPLSDAEVDDLVAFLEALDGEGFADPPPRSFPP